MAKEPDPDNLSYWQRRWMTAIQRAGCVRFERMPNGEEHYFLDNGKTIPFQQVHVLKARGLLMPLGDGLFDGATQSFAPR